MWIGPLESDAASAPQVHLSQDESRDELSDKELDSQHPKQQFGQPTAQADLHHIDLEADKFSIEELENEQSQQNTYQEFKKE